jgi:hypothetical protein
MTQSQGRSFSVLAGIALSTALWGCHTVGSIAADTGRTRPVVTMPLAGSVHQAVVREADSLYDFGNEREAITVTDHDFLGPIVDDGTIPRMTIATARLKPNAARPLHRIIARITSQRAYPNMGIQRGYNYVWRSSWFDADSSGWKTLIIPRDSSTSRALVRDRRRQEYTHGRSPEEPRLVILKVHSVALGLCLDDPMCPTGHCGYY